MRLKSVGAVAAGIGANFLAVPVDMVLHAAQVYPAASQEMSDGLYALALAYRIVFAILGGWVTARLAPHAPMKHALVLGGLGVLLSSLGAAAFWNTGHHWYPLSLIAITVPATWAGAQPVNRSKP